MVLRQELSAYCEQLLQPKNFKDYCPNGLQVEGRAEIQRLVTGVTASMDVIEAALAFKADAVLVHHGYFWKGEAAAIVGMKQRRIKALLEADMNLFAYHLPLDAHPEFGNNAGLAAALGWSAQGSFNRDGVGSWCALEEGLTGKQLQQRLSRVLQREALHIEGGPEQIRRVGWCTGGAQSYIERAVELGLDAFISGEISEQTVHIARECGIHYFAAGHHATERFGPKLLGHHLAERFDLTHEFVDSANPA